jgi:pyridoxamine 5'-phosphate oxidase family protein
LASPPADRTTAPSEHAEDRAISAFTDQEISYLQNQRLGRLGTVGADGQPHVVPVTFRYNPDTDTIDIGGHGGFATRKKWRDVQASGRATIVIDDVPPPWQPRGVEIRGSAEALTEGGRSVQPSFDPELIRITPRRIVSWGIEGNPTSGGRSVA